MQDMQRPADIAAHMGDDYDRYLGAIVPPVFQNTLFTRKREQHGYSLYPHQQSNHRNSGKEMGALENAPAAGVFASGIADHYGNAFFPFTSRRPCALLKKRLLSGDFFYGYGNEEIWCGSNISGELLVGRNRTECTSKHKSVLCWNPLLPIFLRYCL